MCNMAAAKRKRTKRRRTTTKKKSSIKKTQSNLIRVCLLLFGMALCVIAIFHLGVVGQFIYQLFNLIFGTWDIVIMLAIIGLCGLLLFKKTLDEISIRYYVGFLFIVLAWLLFEACQEFSTRSDASFWYGFVTTCKNAPDILFYGKSSQGGLFGTLLLGIFGTLFDYVGSYVFVVLFAILGIVFIGYDWIVDFIKNKPNSLFQAGGSIKEKKVKKEKSKEIMINNTQDVMEDFFDEKTTKKQKKVDIPEPIDSSKVEEPITIEKRSESRQDINYGQDAYINYKLPKLHVLNDVERKSRTNANSSAAKEQGKKLIEILNEFGVEAQLVQIHIGPSVTKFEVKPELGVRVNKISNLQYDIKMGLAATDIRIEAPIPGKNAVGIEIPNVEKTNVQMKDLIRSIPPKLANKRLLFCLGKNLMGSNVYGQLNRMPHLLIAGATGSGKSVCVNSIICSLLLRTRPDEVKMILIDPKKVEFTPYKGIPHLLAPVITDGEMANKALKVVVNMMDHRYDIFGETGVRNISAYNAYIRENPDLGLQPLPTIVVIIDELADLMLVAAKEVEGSIQRITQLARAAGIHLIVATQRPSVDVITGVIKANIPSRIAFAVSQAVDSRTILDQSGAERLLGYGDMLYLPNGETSPQRIQGVFIKDDEVNRVAQACKEQAKPQYDDTFIQLRDLASQGEEIKEVSSDPLYEDVKAFVIESRRASTSLIQRRFSVGYSRAARLMDVLEMQGIIGPARGSKPREILVQNTLEEESDSV